MKFGLSKCATLTMKRGKKVEDKGIFLPSGETMKDLGESDYKYLGALEACDIKAAKMKEAETTEYNRRMRRVLRSKLNAGNMIQAINTWAVSVFRYTAGILKWTHEELLDIDRKTRKMMTMNGMLHPRANVARLYLPRIEGGRGLISAEECVRTEEHGLSDYVKNSEKGFNRLLTSMERDGTKREYMLKMKEHKEKEWKEKALHGQYPRLVADTEQEKTFNWIRNGYMKKETEGMLTAAQDQALPTRWRKVNIEKRQGTPLCRMCNERDETTFHIQCHTGVAK